jgi:hypothetical protein
MCKGLCSLRASGIGRALSTRTDDRLGAITIERHHLEQLGFVGRRSVLSDHTSFASFGSTDGRRRFAVRVSHQGRGGAGELGRTSVPLVS